MKSLRGMLSALLILTFSGCNLPGKEQLPASPTSTSLPISSPAFSPQDNTITPTQTQVTATLIPYPPEVELLGADWLGSGYLMVSLRFPAPINLDYRAAAGEVDFNCRGLNEQTDQLICTALGLREGRSLEFVVHNSNTNQEIYRGTIFVPYQIQNKNGDESSISTKQPSGTNPPPGSPKPTQP